MKRLPVPEVVPHCDSDTNQRGFPVIFCLISYDGKLTSASSVVKMLHAAQAEVILDGLDGCRVSAQEGGVDLFDDGLNVGGAVRRHVLADGLEILPEVPVIARLVDCDAGQILCKRICAYRMAWTTAEDAYPAAKRPGLLKLSIQRIRSWPHKERFRTEGATRT